MKTLFRRIALSFIIFAAPLVRAAESRGETMDYGPVFASSLGMPVDGRQKVLAYKSLTIKLGNDAYVSFDTELLRYAAGWTGGWLDLKKTHMTSSKGSQCPDVAGKIVFTTGMAPGVSHKGSLADTRNNPRFPGRGPLPKEHGHYKGLYLHGDQVVIAYSAAGGEVLELPSAYKDGDQFIFTRVIRLKHTTEPLTLRLADDADKLAGGFIGPTNDKAVLQKTDGALSVILPPADQPAIYTVAISTGDYSTFAASLKPAVDPITLTRGGPSRWAKPLATTGQFAKSDSTFPYVVDSLALPENNPWFAWMRVTAFDFFPDGKSAALATWSGDVWVVSGIDESLAKLTWRRFATGLYEPLGLKIVNGTIYTLGRDQITGLHDLDHDGEADFYENFNNDGVTGDQYHLFKYDLDTDPAGNFYYATGGAWAGNDIFNGASAICKVSADGAKLEYIGHGFRAPNGMAVGPAGEIVTGDNQGHWMPSSKINYIPPGKTDGFYGFPFDPRIEKSFDVARFFPAGLPKTFDPPLCWVPYFLDNSSGGQTFVTGDKWGPFKGHILHTSYGKSALFMVMHELVDGVPQGGVWRFPLAFEAGIMRARFNPGDGQLYVAGLRGWQTNGAKDGCFQRVRYTGKPVRTPQELHATAGGISVTFTTPLDPATANDPASYDIEQWTYKWAATYGSPEYSVANPTKKGRDTVDIKSAKLQADGKTVFLEIPTLAPVMQMAISYKLKSADGQNVEGTIYNTINKLK